MRDWDWLRPNTINLYQYCGNDPINGWDPYGMYVIQGTGDEEVDAENARKFEAARQANLNREGDIAATAVAYGKPGVENGVVVTFKDSTITGSPANVLASIEFDADSQEFVLNATVTINPSLSGVELEAAVGHEGSHLEDDLAFLATSGDFEWDASKNPTHRETEFKAYMITHEILRKTNDPSRPLHILDLTKRIENHFILSQNFHQSQKDFLIAFFRKREAQGHEASNFSFPSPRS